MTAIDEWFNYRSSDEANSVFFLSLSQNAPGFSLKSPRKTVRLNDQMTYSRKVSGSQYHTPRYYSSAAAVAVEDINNDDTILKGYRLRYVWDTNETDTLCDEFKG